MCRMIAHLGDDPSNDLLDGFVRMARGENERHERNPTPGEFVHGDGWGVVYVDDGTLQRYRSERPCWEDPRLADFADKRIVLLHARRASCGEVSLENTHPLTWRDGDEAWFFCHNGTIDDPFPTSDDRASTTDSEGFFRHLLKGFDPLDDVASIGQSIERVVNYTALNSFLLNRDALYVIDRYDEAEKAPTYYTIYRYADRERLIFSSERLSAFAKDDWKPLANGAIVKIPLNDGPTFTRN